jgi:hypothetical protein
MITSHRIQTFIFLDGILTRWETNEAMQIPQQALIKGAFNTFEKPSHLNKIQILHIF